MNRSVQNTEKTVELPTVNAVMRGIWKQIRYDSAKIIVEIVNVTAANKQIQESKEINLEKPE